MSDDVIPDWLGEPTAPDRPKPEAPDPVRSARGGGRPALPKRFYKEAGLSGGEGGFRLTLDGRPANTPAKKPLAVPTRALGEAMAAEWAAQAEVIDPARMPLTRLINTAIDGVADRREAVIADLAAYAGTDLVAYRAAGPERLVAEQGVAWDPVLDWAHEALGARFVLSEGVMHVTQPETTVRSLEQAIVQVEGPFRLADRKSVV